VFDSIRVGSHLLLRAEGPSGNITSGVAKIVPVAIKNPIDKSWRILCAEFLRQFNCFVDGDFGGDAFAFQFPACKSDETTVDNWLPVPRPVNSQVRSFGINVIPDFPNRLRKFQSLLDNIFRDIRRSQPSSHRIKIVVPTSIKLTQG